VLRLVDMLIARVWGGQADPVRRHEMSEIEIVIAAAGGQRQADVFTAHWGDILLATSRTPFFDSARKLLEIGAEPSDLLIMRHRGSSTPSLRARIAVAAKLAVTDTRVGPRYVPWVDLRGICAKTEETPREADGRMGDLPVPRQSTVPRWMAFRDRPVPDQPSGLQTHQNRAHARRDAGAGTAKVRAR